MSLASFIATALVILLTPGPTNTMLAASGAAMGARKAMLLPLAEAAGYAVAVSLFVATAGLLHGSALAAAGLKSVAAAWLLFSAVRLWSQPVVPELPARNGAFRRVLVTTLLNPKALLVGTIVIPGLMPDAAAAAVACFVSLSTLAGFGWVMFGAMLPAGVRRYSYRAAALIVGGFSLVAAASALQA